MTNRMTPGGRLSAAIEILTTLQTQHRPAAETLADWGKAHRFAGSADRAAIGNIVYDALRRKLSTAARMGADTPRALAIASAPSAWGMSAEAVAALCSGSDHGPDVLTSIESEGLARELPSDTPDHIRADVPDWLWPSFQVAFGADALAEGKALAARAPVDLRVNTHKSNRPKVLKSLETFGAVASPYSPLGVRVAAPKGSGRSANVQVEPGFIKGWYEVQDEGSQIAALIAADAAGPASQVLDCCAGSGGKTLAISAALANKGQIFAHDTDRMRLAPIHERLQRAGARNVQVLPTRDNPLDALTGKMDCVVVDAPCTGTGVWRRRPESKWRLTPEALEKRIEEQRAILTRCVPLLKPNGRLVYITCSLLPDENEDQVDWLCAQHPRLTVKPLADSLARVFRDSASFESAIGPKGLTLRPAQTHTDGFFVTVLCAV